MAKPFLRKAIVAINGSKSSMAAAMYAIIMAKQYQMTLKVVFVVDTATIKYLTNFKLLVASDKDTYKNNLTSDGNNYLEYVQTLAKTKGVKIETQLRSGSVADEIISAADEYSADVIIIGGKSDSENYTRSAHKRISATSVNRAQIINCAHCSVLVTNTPDIEKLFKIM